MRVFAYVYVHVSVCNCMLFVYAYARVQACVLGCVCICVYLSVYESYQSETTLPSNSVSSENLLTMSPLSSTPAVLLMLELLK